MLDKSGPRIQRGEAGRRDLAPQPPPSARPLLVACLATAVVLCDAPPAAPYAITLAGSGPSTVLRWPTKNMAYHLHPDCSPDLPASVCLQALRDSFAQWTGHDCSDASFTELGTSTHTALTSIGGASNGKNELAFIEDSWAYGSFVLGVTGPFFSGDGAIVEADIAFNGVHHTWSTDGASAGTMDVMNVAVHEIGHYLGLQHALTGYDPTDPPTMAPQADPSLKSRDPEADDIAGLCFLYPLTTHACETDADCPYILEQTAQGDAYTGSLACEGGLCGGVSTELPSGVSDVGELCFSDADCAEGLTCQAGGFGSDSVCRQACEGDGECPTGFECSGGICQEPGGPAQPGAIGYPCTDLFDCFPNACLEGESGSFCRETCFGDAACGEGWHCEVIFFGVGGCAPDDGGYDLGAECSAPGDCKSALCTSGVCSDFCEVLASADACGDALVCARAEDTALDGFCVPPGPAALGETCERDADCATLFCVDLVCGTPCDVADGTPCVTTTETCEVVAEGAPLGACAEVVVDTPDPDTGGAEPIQGGDGGCAGGPAHPVAPGLPWLLFAAALLLALTRRRAAAPASSGR